MIRRDFRPSGFFVLRTPLLPLTEFAAWGMDRRGAPRDTEWDEDLQILRRRLQERFEDPVLLDALFIASPSLYERIGDWRNRPDSESGRSVERAVVRYFSRMTARCTPFGLFAGGSVGRLGGETRLELHDVGSYNRHTRLDMGYLDELCHALVHEEGLSDALRYVPNSSLYETGEGFRYAECRRSRAGRTYDLVDVERSEALEVVLSRAIAGAGKEELAESIVGDGVGAQDARRFVGELIAADILVPELEPALTGSESTESVLEQLDRLPAAATWLRPLRAAREAIVDLDGRGLGSSPTCYTDIADLLSSLPARVDPARLFQVDLAKPAEVMTLAPDVVDAAVEGAEFLYDFFAPIAGGELLEFGRRFEDRYGDREVPLCEALDEDAGIGFESDRSITADASPLLDGLGMGATTPARAPAWTPQAQAMARELQDAMRCGAREITLTSDRIPRSSPTPAPLPDAFHLTGTVLPDEPGQAIVVLGTLVGPSGARLLGRFCHGDAALLKAVRQHIAEEQALDPDVTYFEIVHLPEGRMGNVLARPLLRDHELAFLGRSGAPDGRTLSIRDLTVSVRAGRVLLRSRTLGREVRPRLTTAHNTRFRALPVYRFLASLQCQGEVEGLAWQWGVLGAMPYLPRVTYGRAVLARARWNLDETTLRELAGASDARDAFRRLQDVRARLEWPRFVGLADGDNVLPVDLDNVLSCETFRHVVRRRSAARVEEMLPDPGGLVAKGPEGRFANEFVLPFVRRTKVRTDPAREDDGSRSTRDRTSRLRYPPGSTWLYVKIYAGAATIDRLVGEELPGFLADGKAEEWFDRWFFLRYGDPDWHLRLRVHGTPDRLLGTVLPNLRARLGAYEEAGLVWRTVLDTYDPEVRRYGGPHGISLCERIFGADSEAVTGLLAARRSAPAAEARWIWTLRGLDAMLDDCGFDMVEKHSIAFTLADAFGKEFGVAGALKKRVLSRFRECRANVIAALSPAGRSEPSMLSEILQGRSEVVRPLLGEYARRERSGDVDTPLPELAGHLLHLHVNRMLRSSARAHEVLLYRFLERGYDSVLARLGSKRRARATVEVDR